MTDVQQSLLRSYPSELRSAGVDGTVTMRLYVGADGRVLDTYPLSATHNLLTPAAETVVRTMQFRPAELNGERVGVWVEMPINFQSDA